MIRSLPLHARNRLAETILAALHHAEARRELAALAGGDISLAGTWLQDAARDGEALRARAGRAARAIAQRPLDGDDGDLGRALDDAAVLFDAGLFFEVHELLEPHWQQAVGAQRQALQGLIQIAVGYQHLANGNVRGARSLLVEGAQRIEGGVLAGRHLDGFARGVLATQEALAPESIPLFPRST